MENKLRLFFGNKKVFRIFTLLSIVFWWLSIIPLAYHILYCIVDGATPEAYTLAITSSPVILTIIIAAHWLLQGALHIMVGIAIRERKLNILSVLCISGIALAVLMYVILHLSTNMVWNIGMWAFLLIEVFLSQQSKKGEHVPLLYLLIVVIASFIVSWVRYHYSVNPYMSLWEASHSISYELQNCLRSFAMLFTGLWICSMPQGDSIRNRNN